ncbi:MAG: glycine zipper 2TM domain-containing protein [Desulfobacter sp.]|nr:glycine zipper 2TM domain-containing protein [Desulfobacter sp.]WDP84537.1 MAG: glycine zipper 2TM domain-containing protein [Desulfobacter sp.]
MGKTGCIIRVVLSILALVILGTGCGPSKSSNVYTSDQAQRAHTVEAGTVESIKAVTIEPGKAPGAGTVIGGVAGGVLGSTIGSGSGRTVATVAGALAGAAGGAAAQKKMGTTQGLEIVVTQDNGRKIVVVQKADVQFAPGDRVRVLTSPDGTTRISK